MKLHVGRRLNIWYNLQYNGKCPLCGENSDTEEHAFMECK